MTDRAQHPGPCARARARSGNRNRANAEPQDSIGEAGEELPNEWNPRSAHPSGRRGVGYIFHSLFRFCAFGFGVRAGRGRRGRFLGKRSARGAFRSFRPWLVSGWRWLDGDDRARVAGTAPRLVGWWRWSIDRTVEGRGRGRARVQAARVGLAGDSGVWLESAGCCRPGEVMGSSPNAAGCHAALCPFIHLDRARALV